jgi:hypothetical protein
MPGITMVFLLDRTIQQRPGLPGMIQALMIPRIDQVPVSDIPPQ